MPLTIRELHIKVSVEQPGIPGAQRPTKPPTGQEQTEEKQQLIADCVQQVMQIINEKKER